MALSTSTNGSIESQTNTQSPQQSAGSGAPTAASAKSVQPGTASNLLSGPGGGSEGMPLNSTILPVANLNTTAQTAVSHAKVTTHHQHPNAALLSIVAILVILAAAATWATSRSAKNTTYY